MNPGPHTVMRSKRPAIGHRRGSLLEALRGGLCVALLLSTALVCAADGMAAPRLLIFGEQHDQPDQQRQVAAALQELAGRGQLAAVVLEMAEVPHNTTALPRDATESAVRAALQWQGWPWDAYADVIMSAVRAGVPVWGGNLPRSAMRAAMADAQLDTRIGAAAREALREAVRSGHCDLLPTQQEPGMVRIQIARDQSMAKVVDTVARQVKPDGGVVLLLTGRLHAARDRGVPVHLLASPHWAADDIQVILFGPSESSSMADVWRPATVTPQPDYCAQLRQSIESKAAAQSGSAASAPPAR